MAHDPISFSREPGEMMVDKRIGAVVVLLLLLLVQACSRTPQKKPPPPPMRVVAAQVEQGDLEQQLDVSGGLQYIANTTLSAEVSAQVKEIPVQDGQKVDEGQLLIVFDDTKIKETSIQAASNLKKNEAVLEYNKSEWEKNQGLVKSGAISQTVYEQKLSAYQNSLAQVEADRSAFNKALDDLKKTRVKSPITGRLAKRYVEKGDWVTEGGKLFLISDYRKVYLEAAVSDVDLARLNIKKVLQEGLDAEVTVDSYPGQLFSGRLTYIEPVANEARLFHIRIYLENPEMMLMQGMFARGRIVVHTLAGVLRIPVTALLDQIRNNDYNTVFAVDKEGKAQLTRVKIGVNNRRYAEVLEGLKRGDVVVTGGKEVLTTGQPLKMSESAPVVTGSTK